MRSGHILLAMLCLIPMGSTTVGSPSDLPRPYWKSLIDGEVNAIGMPTDNVLPVLSYEFYGLDLETGEILWPSSENYSWGDICSDIEQDAGALFPGPWARCIETKTGKVFWKGDMKGFGGFHALGYGKLFVAESTSCHFMDTRYREWTSVIAFDEFTGDRLWTFDASSMINSDIEVGKGLVLFSSSDGIVFALDHKTGNVAWTVKTGKVMWIQPQPVIAESRALIPSDALYCVDVETGQVIWTVKTSENVWTQPVAVGGRIIVSSDALYCIDFVSGSVIWKNQFSRRSPVVYNTRVYAYTGLGYTCLNIADGTTLWTFEQPCIDFGKPVASEDLLVFGMSNGTLMALDAVTGEQQWMYDVSEPITSPPLLLGNFIVIGTESGTVIALGTPEYEKRTQCEELLDSSKRLLFRKDYPGALKILEGARCTCSEEDLLEINALIEYAQNQKEKEKWIEICKIIAGVAIVLICGFLVVRKVKNR